MLSLLRMCHKNSSEDSTSKSTLRYCHNDLALLSQKMQWLLILPDMYSRCNEKMCDLLKALLSLIS